jgi:transposase
MPEIPMRIAAACPAVPLVAIEPSKSTWRVATAEPGSPKISQHCLPGGDAAGLLALRRRLQQRAVTRLGCPVRPVTVMEAGFDGFWLHRFLVRHEVDSHVVDPASVLVDRRARRVKTDRSDAQSLLRALAAHLRGEGPAGTMVRVPSVEAEDLRRQVRERDALVEQGASQGSAAARILALSKLKGIGRTAAAVLVREVFHRDFANRRQVASFFGLTPSPWSSGTTHVEQGISKSGSRRARSGRSWVPPPGPYADVGVIRVCP